MRLPPAQRGPELPRAPRAAPGPASPHRACGYAHPLAACLLSHVTVSPTRNRQPHSQPSAPLVTVSPTRTRTQSSSPLSRWGLSLNPSPLDGGRSSPQPRSPDLAALPTAPAVAWPLLLPAALPPPRRGALSLPDTFTLLLLRPQLPHASAGKPSRATRTGPMPLTPLGWGLAGLCSPRPAPPRDRGQVTRILGPGPRGVLFHDSRHV